MEIPTDPASMQAYVLEQMLKGKQDGQQQESRAPAKFSKQMAELIETKLRDRLHHEIVVQPLEPSASKLLQAATAANTSVSVLWDSTHNPFGLMRCDGLMRALLGRLCFGGDVESAVVSSEKPATEAELGLQGLLGDLLAKALADSGHAKVATMSTLIESEFEKDEFDNREAYCFPFELQIGASTSRFELVVCQSLILGNVDTSEINQIDSVGSTNDEMMQTPVLASVKLKPQPTTLGRIKSLRVGDCLPLIGDDQLNGQFMVSDQEIFECQIGRSGDAYSLKIAKRADPEPHPIQALTPLV